MASLCQKTERKRSQKKRPNKENLKKDLKRMAGNLAILRTAAPSGKTAQ